MLVVWVLDESHDDDDYDEHHHPNYTDNISVSFFNEQKGYITVDRIKVNVHLYRKAFSHRSVGKRSTCYAKQ